MINYNTVILIFFITLISYAQKSTDDSLINDITISERNKILKKDRFFNIDHSIKVGFDLYKKKDFINSEKVFLEILEKGDKATYKYVLVEKKLGDVNRQLHNYNKAIIHFNNVKDKVKGEDLIKLLNSLGDSYIKTYNYDKALEVLSRAYQVNEKSNNLLDKAGTLGLIASIYTFDSNKLEERIKYYEQILQIFIKINEPKGILTSYINLGDLYLHYGNYNKALELLTKGLFVAIKLKDEHAQGIINLTFSEIFYEQGRHDDGLKKIDEAYYLFDKNKLPREKALADYLYGIFYLKKGKYKNADSYLKKSLKTCLEINNLKYTKKNYYSLHELSLKKGNLKNALNNYKNYVMIKDSINNLNQSKKNSQYKLNLEFNELEKELTNSKSELKILNQDNQLSQFRIIFLSLSILFILIVSLFVFINIKNRNKRLKITNEKLNYEQKVNDLIKKENELKLEFKSRETRDFALNISDKLKLLKTLKTKLLQVSKKIKEPNVKKDLNDLLLSLSQNIEINKEKIILNRITKDYKKDFVYKLKKISPELSKKEIQVAVYLVMGFSSKEVAVQLGLASRTVDNYRAAIRSKLNIENKQNLFDFLNTLN